MTTNKPMTGEQLDELLTVAVNMQRDAETDCNRPSAMFAYAVQVAVLELRKVRNDASALAAENAGLKHATEQCKEYFTALVLNQLTPYNPSVMNGTCAIALDETPATDAFLAEVRAQGVEMLRDSIADLESSIEDTIDLHHYCSDFAAEIRKGVQS
ncbi:hypothetical protein TUM17556_27520 [Enterobacter asburiae]|uniref:hypothetical protein n=1 Tax=Enterobacter asburiae TaxID=61645 RepID=UPI001E56FCB3|nr:hypothetical protein [Enterobacter asburiae]GJK30833.1 hypothetical protein TUM17556_27520 [Enterobacter asburiae]